MILQHYFTTENLNNLYTEKLANSKAKGIDKRNAINFVDNLDSEIAIIIRKVKDGSYEFTPFLEKLKLKGRNKTPRLISIPTLRDRIVLLAIKEILHDIFPDSVNRKLPNSYIRDIKGYLKNSTGTEYFIKLDIKNFYDNIDREVLLQILRKENLNNNIMNLIEKAIKTPTIPIHSKKEAYTDFLLEKGVPQGLSISNILAQIYLKEVDQVIDRRKYFYRRYVDDIIILNREKISSFRYKNIEKALNSINLQLNHNKIEQNYLNQGFTFLSYKVTTNNISIAEANVELFIRRVAGKFTWFKNGIANVTRRPQWLHQNERFKEVFIEELNETITGIISKTRNYGWLFYFSEMTDESLLHRIDNIISVFFHKIAEFNNTRPNTLKTLSRAYKVIKYQRNKSYLANYDNFETIRSKRNYLVFRGKIDPEADYTDIQIDQYFEKFRKNQIRNIEKDIGYNYN